MELRQSLHHERRMDLRNVIRRVTAPLVATIALLVASPVDAAGPRVEPVMGLPDIAIASWDAYGPVIYVNPVTMQQAGHAARFFMAHEYAHHNLGHVVALATGSPYAQPWLRHHLELAADCTAARTLAMHGDALALQAAYAVFQAQGPTAADPLHPAGIDRAQTIAACSQG